MHVYELRRPGTWLADTVASAVRREAEGLLHLLESALADAAISLSLFEEACAAVRHITAQPGEGALARRAEERVRARYASDLRKHHDPDAFWSVAIATNEALRSEVQRERWGAGEVPRAYRHRLPFLYAKSFAYALDTIGKTLGALAGLDGAPAEVRAATDRFYQALPNLTPVRNSAHHPEDRIRGRAHGKPIPLKPILTHGIHAPDGGVLVIDQLTNNRYGGTLADGSFGEVEVSRGSARVAQEAIQASLDAWPWKGWASNIPS